jgi:hypothetical protein
MALGVDPDDLKRHLEDGVFFQHAFIRCDGTPYLTPAERELFISQCCNSCWISSVRLMNWRTTSAANLRRIEVPVGSLEDLTTNPGGVSAISVVCLRTTYSCFSGFGRPTTGPT